MKNFLWIYRYVIKYWGYAVLNIVTNILSAIFGLFSLAMLMPVMNLLFDKQETIVQKPTASYFSAQGLLAHFNYFFGQFIQDYGKTNALLFVCVFIIVMFFFKNLFRFLGLYFVGPIRNGVSKDLRNDMYGKILDLPLSFFNNERKGDVMARMTSDVQEIEWSILTSLEAMFREPFTVFAYLIALFTMSARLTLFILILVPITGLLIGRIGKSLKKTSAIGQQKMGFILSVIEETLSGIRIIKAFTAEKFTFKRFSDINEDYNALMIRMYRKRDIASPLSEFLGAVVLVSVFWYGGKLIFEGDNSLSASMFFTYIAVVSQIMLPAKSFTQAYYNVQKGIASAERVRMILEAPVVIEDEPDAVEKKDFSSEITYSNVSFAYNNYDDKQILKNIDLSIQKGTTVALVGQSGAGKTTMADLLPRFYDVNSGQILIDGVPIKEIKLHDLRKLIGVVTQESILFNDTVYNNIAFGMTDVTEEQVIEAAKIANAHEFIVHLKDGYQANIGDRGGKLSGGQRQRLSIARAVLKNPPILILDEATSALDTESERLVQDALTKLMCNRTSIVIAHRLSTIIHADEIIVMQKGEIIERGSHSELIEQNSGYKRLYDLQVFAV